MDNSLQKSVDSEGLTYMYIKLSMSASVFLQHIMRYFWQIVRYSPDSLELLLVTGKVEGKRPRGRSPTFWTYQLSNRLDIYTLPLVDW